MKISVHLDRHTSIDIEPDTSGVWQAKIKGWDYPESVAWSELRTLITAVGQLVSSLTPKSPKEPVEADAPCVPN